MITVLLTQDYGFMYLNIEQQIGLFSRVFWIRKINSI